jgi:hypothetical protein
MKRTPQEIAAQIQALRAELADELRATSAEQRRDLRNRTKSSPELIATAVSAINQSSTIAALVGKNQQQVRDLMAWASRWAVLEGELRTFLNEVTSTKLAHRHTLDLIATQTYAVTKQLIRSPDNAGLIPIFEEMQTIRKNDRRKKRRATSQDPEDGEATTE